MQDINKLLIENILPSSVAGKFLAPDRPVNVNFFGEVFTGKILDHYLDFQELYARQHENVCVMFASIPNFKDFWSQWDTSRKLECLRLLNEIVCEFDKVSAYSNIFAFIREGNRKRCHKRRKRG